jgi:diguanylate cyclase (GGDEF)-like protein/PAS domain S-box-containing protein
MPVEIDAPAHRRVRVSMYVAFVAIAAAALLSIWKASTAEEQRAADAELIDYAAGRNVFAERLGRLAATVRAGGPEARPAGEAIREQLARSRTLADAMDPTLRARLGNDAGLPASPGLEHWFRAREQLWQRVDTLLARLATGEGVTVAAAALEEEAQQSADAAHVLVEDLRRLSQARSRAAVAWIRGGGALTVLLLGVLAFTVVEPTVRSVQRQHRRLSAQAAELERQALVAERTDNMVSITDAERRIVWVNDAFVRKTGYSLERARGKLPSELLDSPRTDRRVVERVREAQLRGEAADEELMIRAADGTDHWVRLDLQPLHDRHGVVNGFISVQTEITQLVSDRLKNEALMAVLPDGVLVRDGEGRVTDANPAVERMLALPRERLIGQTVDDFGQTAVRENGTMFEPEELPGRWTLRHGVGRGDEVLGLRSGPEGALRWLLVNTEPLRDALGQLSGAVSCFVDVTDSRRLQDQLATAARTDALTGLPNREVVQEHIARALEHRGRHPAYRFAVLFLDFDRFKQVNDTHGHGVGDELLREVARRLMHTLRPGDAIARVGHETRTAARIGGDEFVIVLEGVPSEAAVTSIVNRLLEALNEPYTICGVHVHSGASIGVVLDPAPDATADSVLRDADTAMYEAKRAGRGRHAVFDPSMHLRVAHATRMENDLRLALTDRQLSVVYQPIVDLAGGRLHAVEALVRWRHPVDGPVSPASFIPVAEDSGLIADLGRFVLQTACAQLARWKRALGERAPRRVGVNLSREQLRHPQFVDDVRTCLDDNGLAPGELQLEVTESLAAQDAQVLGMLATLRTMGVSLALDDFGTGYSSLACLHQMPVDTVKIDRSFVADAEDSSYHRVVIEATLRVARTLGMASVAEGIETDGQASLMLALGCQLGQGYRFSQPLDPGALTRWLHTGRPPAIDPVVDVAEG